MPTVLRIGAFRFYFYSLEPNEPPHVGRRDATIKVWLHEVEFAKSRGFRAHEIRGIVATVEEHRTRLLEARTAVLGANKR